MSDGGSRFFDLYARREIQGETIHDYRFTPDLLITWTEKGDPGRARD